MKAIVAELMLRFHASPFFMTAATQKAVVQVNLFINKINL